MSKARKRSQSPRILLWDIEATNLNANFGFVICIGYRWLGEKKTHLISIRNFREHFKRSPWCDKLVVKEFAKVLAQADLQVYHYGGRYDQPMIRSKMLEHDLGTLPEVPEVDTWRVSKYRLKLHSNRLETLQNFIPSVRSKKTAISHAHWRKAMSGHIPSIRYIEEHCIADVDVLEQVYRALAPHVKSHPNLSKLKTARCEGCPNCGSAKINRRGVMISARGRAQRMQCRECAAWFNLPEQKA